MKASVLRGLKNSLLLLLWLLLVQFTSSLLSMVVILILGLSHPIGPTPLWQWIMEGVLICSFWFVMGWVAAHVVQPRPVGATAVLTIWTLLTSLMRNAYLFLLPQRTCGGMLRESLRLLCYDPSAWRGEYWDLPSGCLLLSAALGVGLLFRRKRKARNKADGEST